MSDSMDRRPLKTRQRAWAHRLAHLCVRVGISPNQMSVASIGCAAIGALAYGGASVAARPMSALLLIGAAASVQMRLLANMLDGLMAVEEGRKEPTGAIYNELPDRLTDTIFLVAAGYAAGWPVLGWMAAVLAVSTAYVRAVGGSLGYAQDFSGPMAKPHRMFALTAGSLLAALLPGQPVLAVTLAVIDVGCAITVLRRVSHLAARLSGDPHD